MLTSDDCDWDNRGTTSAVKKVIDLKDSILVFNGSGNNEGFNLKLLLRIELFVYSRIGVTDELVLDDIFTAMDKFQKKYPDDLHPNLLNKLKQELTANAYETIS